MGEKGSLAFALDRSVLVCLSHQEDQHPRAGLSGSLFQDPFGASEHPNGGAAGRWPGAADDSGLRPGTEGGFDEPFLQAVGRAARWGAGGELPMFGGAWCGPCALLWSEKMTSSGFYDMRY